MEDPPLKAVMTSLMILIALSVMGCGKKAVSYQQDIVPIIKENCLDCHKVGGIGFEKTNLNLQDYKGLMKGTIHGPVVVPGSSISSTLVQLLEHKADPSINMPHHKKKLNEKSIEVFKQWIDQGAKNN